jgi:hypothetical protein
MVSPPISQRPMRASGRRSAAVVVAILLVAATVSAIVLRIVAVARTSAAPDGSAIMVKRQGSNPMPVSDFTHRNAGPSWSPGGDRIVFARSSGDRYHLFTMRASGAHMRSITSGPHVDTQPAWSPDGSRIAFTSDRGGRTHIYTIRPDGSGLRAITSGPFTDQDPTWSPDGSRIAFASDRAGSFDLYSVSALGGDVRGITHDPYDDLQPSWSPDGRRVVFAGNRFGSFDLFTVRSTGGELHRLTSTPADEEEPAWSPAGGSIAFVTRRSGNAGIVVLDLHGTTHRVTGGRADDTQPAWDPDGVSLAFVRATALPTPRVSNTFYVSPDGDGSDGTSWATAWTELSKIDWSVIGPGSVIEIDGGPTACPSPYDFTGTRPGVNCGVEYDTTLNVGASGTPEQPVQIRLSSEPGHNGTAVLFGGRATPLPYCHQATYSAKAVRQYGVLIGDRHDVLIDGDHRSGIMVYGAVQGIRVSSPSATGLTFERMEVFDNGSIVSGVPGGGYNSDDEGFSLAGGTDTLLRGDLVHDNGQDEIQDESRPGGSLNGLVIDTSWLYARREHPKHPGEPFNDLQAIGDGGCTHADAIQLWSGGSGESGLTVSHSILGPLVNQGLYPGDGGTGATWTNVTLSDSLLLTVSHNVISDNKVHGWTLDHDTLYAPQGGFQIPNAGDSSLLDSIKYGGYVQAPGDWATSGDVWLKGDPLPGKSINTDPQFTSLPDGPYPATFAAYAAADFTPHCAACRGSSIHTLDDLLSRIDALP